MKIGIIVKPNAKGQMVIPKKIREILGITSDTHLQIVSRGNGFYIYPVEDVISKADKENSYVKILERTRGAWSSAAATDEAARKKALELTASSRRKRAW